MKHFYFIILAFLLISCGGTKKEQKRTADLVVTFNGEVVHTAYPNYNTEKELVDSLNDDKHPDFIIFSSRYCPACEKLENVLEKTNWRGRVIILNLQEKWVQFIAKQVGVQGIPALIVSRDGGKSHTKIFYGPAAITGVLYYEIEGEK